MFSDFSQIVKKYDSNAKSKSCSSILRFILSPNSLFFKVILRILESEIIIEGHEYLYIILFYVNPNSINNGYRRNLFEEMLRKLKFRGKN